MMKRIFALLLCVATLLGCLVACGKSEDEEEDKDEADDGVLQVCLSLLTVLGSSALANLTPRKML